MTRIVDLRSDTVTVPSLGMREAMYKAKVGDDVYSEDPTVNLLQQRVASLLNKESALFVPSGTMSNLLAMGTHCQRGEEAIVGRSSHIFVYEGGGASAHMGVSLSLIDNESDGSYDERQIESSIRPQNNDHYPTTRCIAIENTHNVRGGTVVPQRKIISLAKLCQKHSLSFHLDGARLWNASVATGLKLSDLADPFDTVSICLSKGLGAPVGSLLAGPKNFIIKAKRQRKALGGGMRQSGVLAAAGLFAIENNFERLSDDHRRAKLLAAGLRARPKVFKNIVEPETNILFFQVIDSKGLSFVEELRKNGVLMGFYGNTDRVRAVTHIDITDDDVEMINYQIERAVSKLF